MLVFSEDVCFGRDRIRHAASDTKVTTSLLAEGEEVSEHTHDYLQSLLREEGGLATLRGKISRTSAKR